MSSIGETYQEQGFYFPIDVIEESQAVEVRKDLEQAEAELADDPERLALLRSYPDRLLPSFDRLIRSSALVDAVGQVLGPDLHVWSAALFDKAPGSTQVVTWHQDLTYWGLDELDEVTAWLALAPSTVESGCMFFLPGSHRQAVDHVDTFDENNLLTRGQQVDVEVNDADGVAVELQPGQASLHHGQLIHSSGPNRSNWRRVGAAIRYVKTSMRQQSGDRTLVAHVAGEDKYGNFRVAEPTKGRLLEEDFQLCREDSEIKRRVLYEGAEGAEGTRY